jgi:D-alanyl-D-alanine carboxypeptidase
MTSEIFDYLDDGDDTALRRELADPSVRWARRDLVAIATADAPRFAPGTSWSHSRIGYMVLGQIAEKATGRPIADSLRDRVSRRPGCARRASRPAADRRPARPRLRHPER